MLGACERLPEDVATTYEKADYLERAMIRALKEATPDTPPDRLEALREQYIVDAARARELRLHIRELLEREIEERGSSETLALAQSVNEYDLRCHEGIGPKGKYWFLFLASGGTETELRHSFWGYGYDCFRGATKEWEELLR